MKKLLKILKMLYSPYLFPEILLALELILVVQLLALSTNPVSYLLQKIRVSDSYWKKENAVYVAALQPDQAPLDPQEIMEQFPELTAFCQGEQKQYHTAKIETLLRDENGRGQELLVIRYNAAMLEKVSGMLDVREDIDPGDTTPICVPSTMAQELPPGTVLHLESTNMSPSLGETVRETTVFTVCGSFAQEQLPVIQPDIQFMTVECLTRNTRELADQNFLPLIVARAEDPVVTAGMFCLKKGTDAEATAAVLNERYTTQAAFCTYASMCAPSDYLTMWISDSLLLKSMLFLMVFITHFIGYLMISTRNKARTNAMLSICGMPAGRIAQYNALSILLILVPAVLVGALLVPLTEKQQMAASGMYTALNPYGGHLVLWECLAVFAGIALLTTFLAVRTHIRKDNTIQLYRKGT